LIILADENVDKPVVDSLRTRGYSVLYVAEFSPGLPDPQVLSKSHELGAVLLTADKDFGELIFRRGQLHSGVVLLRMAELDSEEQAALVCGFFARHSSELDGAFSVLTPRTTRLRRPIQ
jgi:predicted nuclease of predicted toxin-antitoxin system